MSDTQRHATLAPTVDAAPAGGDDHKGARRGAIFIGLVLVVYVVYLVVTGQVAQFLGAMHDVQIPWLLVACGCMVLYLIFGIAAYAIAVWLDPASPVGIRDLISVEMSGIFFGNLTPMMVGSSPAQIYRLTKCGMNVGEASATQFTRFIVYQFGLVAWGAILLIAKMPFFAERYGDITLLCVFSFGGHALLLLGIFAICLMPGLVIRLGMWVISLLARMGLATSKLEGWREFLNTEVYAFSEKFKVSAAHTSSMLLTVVITMLQLGFFYLVPYFLMLSFGHHDVDFFSVMAASAFVQLLSSAVPLPGGTGGAEGGFFLFLGHFYGSAATAGYLLWRLITFIAPTILAAPLLGLKSAHRATVRERWARFSSRFLPSRAARDTRVAAVSASGTLEASARPRSAAAGASATPARSHLAAAGLATSQARSHAATSTAHHHHQTPADAAARAAVSHTAVAEGAAAAPSAPVGGGDARSAAPAAPKPKRPRAGTRVRRTADGITVTPSKLKRRRASQNGASATHGASATASVSSMTGASTAGSAGGDSAANDASRASGASAVGGAPERSKPSAPSKPQA